MSIQTNNPHRLNVISLIIIVYYKHYWDQCQYILATFHLSVIFLNEERNAFVTFLRRLN